MASLPPALPRSSVLAPLHGPARPVPAGKPEDPYAPLRSGPFRWLIASLFAATLARQVQAVAVGWQVYALTRDPLSLGLIGLAQVLPFLAVALFAGHATDHLDRSRIAVVALGILSCCAVALYALSARLAPGSAVWPVYLVVALDGAARSFLTPSRSALAAELVPRELLPRAAAWRSSAWQLASTLGPALGGLLYGFGSASLAHLAGAGLYLLALGCMAGVRRTATAPPAAMSVRGSLGAGLRFIRGQPVVFGAMVLDLFSVLFGGAVALLPVFAAEILHVGPGGLGLLQAAPAGGALVMSLALAHRRPLDHAGRALLLSGAGFGLSILAFALSRSLLLSAALLAASGMFDMVSVVVRSSLLQVLTPPHLHGRVAAVNSIFTGSSNEVGALESGVAASLMGAVPAVVFGGTMTLIVVAVTAWRCPDLRRLERIL